MEFKNKKTKTKAKNLVKMWTWSRGRRRLQVAIWIEAFTVFWENFYRPIWKIKEKQKRFLVNRTVGSRIRKRKRKGRERERVPSMALNSEQKLWISERERLNKNAKIWERERERLKKNAKICEREREREWVSVCVCFVWVLRGKEKRRVSIEWEFELRRMWAVRLKSWNSCCF